MLQPTCCIEFAMSLASLPVIPHHAASWETPSVSGATNCLENCGAYNESSKYRPTILEVFLPHNRHFRPTLLCTATNAARLERFFALPRRSMLGRSVLT